MYEERCAQDGDPCWACEMGKYGNSQAAYCWHHYGYLFPLRGFPLCAACAARWRCYHDPVRLHSV